MDALVMIAEDRLATQPTVAGTCVLDHPLPAPPFERSGEVQRQPRVRGSSL